VILESKALALGVVMKNVANWLLQKVLYLGAGRGLQPRPTRFFLGCFFRRDSEKAGCKPDPAKRT